MSDTMALGVYGYFGVGKTSITVQFVSNVFSTEHDPTLEDYFETSKNINGKIAKLTIYDTAGQEQYSSLVTDNMKDTEGFMLVYSVTDPESFKKIQEVESKVKIMKSSVAKEVPMILIANKIDLPRKISTEEGEELAKRFNCPYIETSAKTRHNIDQAFEKIVCEVRRIRGESNKENNKGAAKAGDKGSGKPAKKGCRQQ